MSPEQLAKLFNQSPAGNQARKTILKELANDNYLLLIEQHGIIWPKKLAKGKPLSYTMGSRQLIIRDESDEVVKKIMLGNIIELTPEKQTTEKAVLRLTIRKND